MIQFQNYPIYILYSYNSQVHADGTAYQFQVQGDKHMHEWMVFSGRPRMEIVEDSAPAHRTAAVEFENTIKRAMDAIVRSPVGRCLLDEMNWSEKLYIIPAPDIVNKAITSKADKKDGGGIRIRINPGDWPKNFDDTLVHELAHALRFSFDRMLHKTIGHDNFGDAEEFFAVQVANIYRSSIGKKQLYDRYPEVEGLWASKGSIYSMMVENPLLIMALKYCLDQEAYCVALSKLPLNRPEYNPFRDYAILNRMAVGKLQMPGMPATEFMPL